MVSLNLPIGIWHAIEQSERPDWPENNTNKSTFIEKIKTGIANLGHALSMSNESQIAYIEYIIKHESTKNHISLGDMSILIDKDKIFLYKAPQNSTASDIKILDMIKWVAPLNDEVIDMQILDKGSKVYIAYAFSPLSNTLISGYDMHILTIDKEQNTIDHKKHCEAFWPDNKPHIILEWDVFAIQIWDEKPKKFYDPIENAISDKYL